MISSLLKRERYFVLEKTLPNPCFKAKAKVEVDFRLVQRDDSPKIADTFRKFKINAKELFGFGNICIVAEICENLVHWSWIAFNETYVSEIARRILISSDSAYIHAVYTVPEYRGLGIAPKALEKICSYLNDRGIKKAYIYTHCGNSPSLRAAHKAGFQKIGTITFIKVCKLKLYRLEGKTGNDYNTLKSMFSIEKTR